VIVLALDTTAPGGSCALVRDGRVTRERRGDAAVSQASRLPADLIALLDEERVALGEVDVFAVATGPGSFTGLRVGIAAMQALAFSGGTPLVGVSALDALAAIGGRTHGGAGEASSPPRRIATWIDAWRGEVYTALYENGREVEPPAVEPPLAALQRFGAPPPLFIGDAVPLYADAIRRVFGQTAVIAEPAAPPLAGTIALMAADAVHAGHRPSPDAIRPLYVRRPDAELSRDARATR
jgi:tRNA threonylcarbamoyladenosine biosynthesis protein TsaB